MIARLPTWSKPSTARWLVAWWIGSVTALACFIAHAILPADIAVPWFSIAEVEVAGFIAAAWLIPGFVLGGWKALLVVVGRSTVKTGTDRVLMSLFAAWAVGWPIFAFVWSLPLWRP